MVTIHDSIHGSIELTPAEVVLVDHPVFQRLRLIRQLGFAETAFPGATHTRFAHSLGAMHMATRIFDRVFSGFASSLPKEKKQQWRQIVRLAVLFHDLGHPAMSHISERVMPKLAKLELAPALLQGTSPERQATHEDYTVKLLLDSDLRHAIDAQVGDVGVSAWHIVALIMGQHMPCVAADCFQVEGIDALPLLSQIVSGEMDADRMDYLRRDAYFCGVSYGNFDHNWLCNSVCAVQVDACWSLALQHKAVWAFENFLLARYHMFLAVYYHHTSWAFDQMLSAFYKTHNIELPANPQAYLQTDDTQLWTLLRQHPDDANAAGILNRRPWRLVLETHFYGPHQQIDPEIEKRLKQAGIAYETTECTGILSKYFNHAQSEHALRIVELERNRHQRMDEYTPLYQRFAQHVALARIYCRPEQYPQAKACLAQS